MTEALFTLGIFAVPVLAGAIVEQRKLEKQSKEIKHYKIENMVLIDSQDNPKVKNLWKNFDEVMFFPTIKRIKIVESQFVCFN